MRFGIIVQDGFLGSAVTAVVDILRAAQFARRRVDASIPKIELAILGRSRISSSEGMIIKPTAPAHTAGEYGTIIVPAVAATTGAGLEQALTAPCGKATVGALQQLNLEQTHIAAGCTGVFTLASTGLLDGRTATTSWFLANAFQERFPLVTLDHDAMVLSDGPLLTAGAAFAHVDLTLALIRRISPELATLVAQTLLVDLRSRQGAYITYDRLNHDDTLIKQFETHVRNNLDEPLDIGRICVVLGVSRRTLERRTQAAVSASPLNIIRRLRVERANHLRRTTDLSIETIATAVGYANAETLRALLRTQTKPTR